MERDETTPLLRSPYQETDEPTRRDGRIISFASGFLPRWSRTQWRVMLSGALVMLIVNFGQYMGTPAQLQIFEDIICNDHLKSINSTASLNGHFPNGTTIPHDDVCKTRAVQEELAIVTGWKNTFDTLPSIAVALPYGVLADKIGRKPVLIMALSSLIICEVWSRIVCWFNMPIRLVWLGGLFQLIGGGDIVAGSLLMTIVADVFLAEERAAALFRLTSMTYLAEIVATPLSALMLKSDPWVPWLLGTVILVGGGFFVLIMPETSEKIDTEDGMQQNACEEDFRDSEETSQVSYLKDETVTQIIVSKAQDLMSSSKFLWTQPRVVVSIVAVFAGNLDRNSWYLLIQYVSAKFHWSISQASMPITARGFMSLVTLLLVVPILSSFLTRTLHYGAVAKDLYIARLCAASGVVGYFMVSIASTAPSLYIGIMFMSFSVPFIASITSVATTFLASKNNIATLYAAISISKSIGSVVAGPLFAGLYAAGLQLGLEWSGLPFAAGSIVSFMILILVTCMSVT